MAKMFKIISLLLFTSWCFMASPLVAQSGFDMSAYIQLTSRGFAVQLDAVNISPQKYRPLYEIAVGNLKDMKELRITNTQVMSPTAPPGVFTFGKIHHLYYLKSGFGRQLVVADRPDFNTVGISLKGVMGLQLGIQSPVFIDYYHPNQTNDEGVVTIRYDPQVHVREGIIQSRNFFSGLNQASVLPGVYMKGGTLIELGNYTYTPSRLEAGISVDAYFIRPELMYGRRHPAVFTTFYISFALLNVNL